MDKPILYIVVPCYNEQEVLPLSNGRLVTLLTKMIADGQVAAESRLLYVNDGSRDNTWPMISDLCDTEPLACGVKLAGNSGHQNALMAGIETAVKLADCIVTIDADLQDDINVIPQMVTEFAQNGCDIVYGVRQARTTDTWFKRTTAQSFYKLMHALGVHTVYNHADFRLMSRRATAELLAYRERNLFLRGIVPLLGHKTAQVFYDRAERMAGESKYPLKKMLNFAIDGITSFSVKPVRMVFVLGVIFVLVAIVMLIYVLCAKLSGSAVSGWSSMMVSIWLVGGCVLVGLGIVGEYVGKIYIEVKDRPRYHIEQTKLK